MKKAIIFMIVAALILTITPAVIYAAPGGKDSPANDNPQSVYLYEKMNFYDEGWDIVWDGAWGKYNFKLSETTISGPFNGHGLVPGTDYTLVEYNGWPAVTVIGRDVADEYGDVHIAGTVDVGTGGEKNGEYKRGLVLSGDLTGSNMTGWNPGAYLFEHNLIIP